MALKHNHAAWLRQWTPLITQFFSFEVAIQATAFITSVLLVRLLDKGEYALYTLANTIQGALLLMSDNGISSGVSSIGGRVWHDRGRFGQLINTALSLRNALARITVPILVPLFVWLLHRNHATPLQIVLLVVAVLLCFYFQMTSTLLMAIPRLHLRMGFLQRSYLGTGLLRLALLAALSLVFLDASVALFVTAASFWAQYYVARRSIPDLADLSASVNAEDRREIVGLIKTQVPNSIYYCFQGQLTIWLVSIIGSAEGVADVGALGRVGMIFAMVGAFMGLVVHPRYARVQSRDLLVRRYWQIVAGYTALTVVSIAIAALFPRQLLWILGDKYAHLGGEMLLMVAVSVLGAIYGVTWHLNATRGWIISPWLSIPVGLVTQASLIWVLGVNSVRDVLWLGLLSAIPGIALNFWVANRGFGRMSAAPAATAI